MLGVFGAIHFAINGKSMLQLVSSRNCPDEITGNLAIDEIVKSFDSAVIYNIDIRVVPENSDYAKRHIEGMQKLAKRLTPLAEVIDKTCHILTFNAKAPSYH